MNRKIAAMLVLGILLAALPAWSYAQDPFARAIAVEGSAQMQRNGAGSWQPVQDGMALDRSDVIKTPAASRVDIAYDKDLNNVMRVFENSTITLGDGQVQMAEGRVMAMLDNLPAGNSFQVKSPNAICGVRGSAFGVNSKGDTTNAFAYQNDTYVTALDGAGGTVGDEITVPEGMMTTVVLGSAPGVPVTMPLSEKSDFNEFKQDMNNLAAGSGAATNAVSPTVSPSGAR